MGRQGGCEEVNVRLLVTSRGLTDPAQVFVLGEFGD